MCEHRYAEKRVGGGCHSADDRWGGSWRWIVLVVLVVCDVTGRKEERKEMFYLMTHSTHFYLQLYGIGHMVKDHSDSERGRNKMFLMTHSTHFYLQLYGVRHGKGRKEIFYLTTHSTHFYLRVYGVGHMVKDHLDSDRRRNKMFNLMAHSTHFYLRLYGIRHMVKEGRKCFI